MDKQFAATGIIVGAHLTVSPSVSYTHLDVYKRQHYDHDVEPRRLRGHNGSNTVGDECNNDGGYSEHMVL